MRERRFESERNEREQAEEIRESKFERTRDGRETFVVGSKRERERARERERER